MPSNNSKYSEEMRTQTAEHILRSGKSATSVAEKLGIDTTTVCRWVRDYRRAKGLPSYSEVKEQPKHSSASRDSPACLRLRSYDVLCSRMAGAS